MIERGPTNDGHLSTEHVLLDYPTTSEETFSKRYTFSHDLGSGAYATVKYATCTGTKLPYAVKIISKAKIPKNYLRKFVPREVDALKRLSIHQHPFISQMREFFETPHRIYLVTRLAMGGDLLNYINSRKYLTEDTARRMICQLLCALDHIHDLDVVHRDLKCENLLIGPDECIMVTDFGFATQQPKNRLLTTFCGSYAYAAPEILAGSSYNGKCTDVWSVGVILYAMLNGKLPFNDTKPKNILAKIKSSPLVMTRQVSVSCERFVRSILSINSMERPLVAELLLKKWLESALRKVMKTLPETVHPSCIQLRTRSSFRMMTADSSEECSSVQRVFTPRHSPGFSPQSPLTITEEFIAHHSSHKTSSTISERVKRKYRQIKTWANRKRGAAQGEFVGIGNRTGNNGGERGGIERSVGKGNSSKVAPINLKYAIPPRTAAESTKTRVVNLGAELPAASQAGRSVSAAPPQSSRHSTAVDFRAQSCKIPHTAVSIKRGSEQELGEKRRGKKGTTRRSSKQEEAINDQILSYLAQSRGTEPPAATSLPPLRGDAAPPPCARRRVSRDSGRRGGDEERRRRGEEERRGGDRRGSYDKALLYQTIQSVAATPARSTQPGITPTKVVAVRRQSNASSSSRRASLEKKTLINIHELSSVYN